ncbi:XVIPCD domain-containing protein [Stenotrophomonas sp. SORGH_AS_0321]|uniref:XVIPCD domain-containing protein n=1 Tax=Stenotrophomonas sp. SORGH_AS_0321 TaxID=3041787 RepID=UPI002864509F|nr:XVIPCD domain-containing protein [Stenotrophomonas sp. SORGH_AS_0321]MDR6095956.1 hypothetical protein [Stenotrophomonas sp. SORGH_AS_0321]
MQKRYTVSIYVAAPGTPIEGAEPSAAGHVYYETSDGINSSSYGFAPIAHGVVTGPGEVKRDDVQKYENPFYTRTMEISKAQYEKLIEFGEDPNGYGFSKEYHGAFNSCIDFTWGALNHAGLHRTNLVFMQDRDFEGSLKPLSNQQYIRSIRAPYPDSELNKEERNLMPERTFLQRFISEQDMPAGDREMLESIRGKVAVIDEQHGRTPDETSERMCGSLFCLAKENGLSRVDHVLLSQAHEQGHAGTNVFVVQGDPSDPAHLRASMPTAVAAQTPVSESMEQAQQISQSQQQVAVQEQTQVQEQQAAVQRMG